MNSFLMIVLLGMILLPPALTHLLATAAHTTPSVAGAQANSGDFIVLPNFFDFNTHVRFDPVTTQFGYQDTLELTVFRNQVATYHKLYTVINRSNHPITIQGVITDEPSPPLTYERLVVTLARSNEIHESQLAGSALVGDIQLQVIDTSIAQGTNSVVIGDREVPVIAATDHTLITDPLSETWEAGTPVYREGILVTEGQVIRSRTAGVTLNPEESAVVTMVVTGKEVENQPIMVPFVIIPQVRE
jgi:hypothetical protein